MVKVVVGSQTRLVALQQKIHMLLQFGLAAGMIPDAHFIDQAIEAVGVLVGCTYEKHTIAMFERSGGSGRFFEQSVHIHLEVVFGLVFVVGDGNMRPGIFGQAAVSVYIQRPCSGSYTC